MQRPDKFGQVYAMSPVFRSESELSFDDRAPFGSGSDFMRQDPVMIYQHNRSIGAICGFPMMGQFHIEMGRDDGFFYSTARTLPFLKTVARDCGSISVDVSRPGGHDTSYWIPAMSRAIQAIGEYYQPSQLAQRKSTDFKI